MVMSKDIKPTNERESIIKDNVRRYLEIGKLIIDEDDSFPYKNRLSLGWVSRGAKIVSLGKMVQQQNILF